ncbi:MAG: DUF6048 family protein [Prevotella sp.]|jgi:hypothetical protein|nr:DUF6048 family protein [Prevotella sp.]MCI2081156.1 DUF6048 family protein [Prevotella sp.]MCI2103041.1 DUF6048 family protein [Prevotella sp.]
MTRQKQISISISRIRQTLLIISSLLICSPVLAQRDAKKAQRQKVVNGKVMIAEPDTIPFFRGVSVSVDAVGPLMLAVSDYGQYEGAVRVNLKDHYFPIIELGYGKADAEDVSTRLSYKTSAPYLRAGIDVNLMKNKHDIYRIFGGMRYAYTNYKVDIFCPGVTDPVWQEKVEYKVKDMKCYYHWLEFVAGVDAKIWGPIRLGWSVRYKRRLMHDEGTMGKTWYVPGFGKQGNSRLGGTFNITFEI